MLVSAASKGARTGLGGGGEPHHPHHTPTTTPGAGLAAGLGERRLWASKSTFKPHWPLEETGALETLPCDQLPNPPPPLPSPHLPYFIYFQMMRSGPGKGQSILVISVGSTFSLPTPSCPKQVWGERVFCIFQGWEGGGWDGELRERCFF